jgi:hypothetical protein
MQTTLDHLVLAVSKDGIAAHSAEVRALLSLARSRRVAALLCDVLADATAPEPVRARALSLIARDLSG